PDRDPFGDADRQCDPGVGGLKDGVGCARGRNEDHGDVGFGVFDRLGNGVEDRDPLDVDAPFAGGDAGDYVGAVFAALLGVEKAASPSDSLDEYFRVFIEQYGHLFLRKKYYPSILTILAAASPRLSPTWTLSPDSLRSFLPSSTLLPSMRTTIGRVQLTSDAASMIPWAMMS